MSKTEPYNSRTSTKIECKTIDRSVFIDGVHFLVNERVELWLLSHHLPFLLNWFYESYWIVVAIFGPCKWNFRRYRWFYFGHNCSYVGRLKWKQLHSPETSQVPVFTGENARRKRKWMPPSIWWWKRNLSRRLCLSYPPKLRLASIRYDANNHQTNKLLAKRQQHNISTGFSRQPALLVLYTKASEWEGIRINKQACK